MQLLQCQYTIAASDLKHIEKLNYEHPKYSKIFKTLICNYLKSNRFANELVYNVSKVKNGHTNVAMAGIFEIELPDFNCIST